MLGTPTIVLTDAAPKPLPHVQGKQLDLVYLSMDPY